ncbi:MAG: zf-HC2 domain-containing protein [Leptospirillia bacterium]
MSELISLGQDQSLSIRQRMMLKMHLLFCKACSRFDKQSQFLNRAMKNYVQNHSSENDKKKILPEDAKERIRRALDEEGHK